MSSVRQFIHGTWKNAAERVLPARSQSAFKEKGVLTPDEFVTAGDHLVHSCPTWSWEAGEAGKARPYLPPDKQFLITRNVPCLRRAAAVEQYGEQGEREVEAEGGEGEGWMTADMVSPPAGSTSTNADGFEEIPSIDGAAVATSGGKGLGDSGEGLGASEDNTGGEDDGNDDVPDIGDLELEDDDEEDEVGGGAQYAAPKCSSPEAFSTRPSHLLQ